MKNIVEIENTRGNNILLPCANIYKIEIFFEKIATIVVTVATFVIAVATIVVDCTIVNIGTIVIISTLIWVSGRTGRTGFPEFTHLFNKECPYHLV